MRLIKAISQVVSGASKPSDLWSRHVTVIGVFRSGTNAVRDILERNYRVKVAYNTYGWKHSPIPLRAKGSRITLKRWPLLVVSKEPYAALTSLHSYSLSGTPYIKGAQSFADFLRQPVILRARRNTEASLRFANPIHYWNAFYYAACTFSSSVDGWHHITHAALLERPAAAIASVAQALLLGKLHSGETLFVPDRVMTKSSERQKTAYKDRPFDKSYYLEKRYLESYSKEDIAFVEMNLDRELVVRMGYSVRP